MSATWLAAFVADLGLERTEFADRGAIALAIIAWILGAISLAALVRCGFPSRALESDRQQAIDEIARHTRTYPVRLLKAILQLGAGAGLVLLMIMGAKWSRPDPEPPPGWSIIRPPKETSAIAVQGDRVWAGGREGVTLLARADGRHLANPIPGDRIRGVKDIVIDGDRVWITHYRGLTLLEDDGSRQDFSRVGDLPHGPALGMLLDRKGGLWVGTQTGVGHLQSGQWTTYTTADGLASPQVDVICEDLDGEIWFGSASPKRGGLSRFDGEESWTTYSTADGLAHGSIAAIAQRGDGSLWVGAGFGRLGGASRRDGESWISIGKTDGLAGEKVRSVFEDGDGLFWLGSEYDGITIIDSNGDKRILTPADGLSGWEVKEIVQDVDGVYWLATENGVTRIEKLDFVPGDLAGKSTG